MPKGQKFMLAGRILTGLGALALLGSAVLYALAAALPDTFYMPDAAQPLQIASMPYVRVQNGTAAVAEADTAAPDSSRNVTLSLFGVVPLKTVRAVSAETRTVQVCGTPFGVKLFSDGALVVAFSDRYTAPGAENPAKAAGLRLGDWIVSAGGRAVRSNDDLTAAIKAAGGAPLEIVYRRGNAQYTATMTPAQDASTGEYKAGVWVRDSGAGIGTMTFLDAAHGTFAGLGHAISDSDTGEDLSLLSGEIVPVTVTGCIKGAAGSPGELRGEFSQSAAGRVLANDAAGVYGVYTGAVTGQAMPVAAVQEIAAGEAEIWTTVNGTTAKAYKINIERVNMTGSDPNRNLVLRVTDPELLQTAGGIVQGMSGSPIVQKGKLVGAVTHVLVNNPARGYGIFAAAMLEKADAVAAQ